MRKWITIYFRTSLLVLVLTTMTGFSQGGWETVYSADNEFIRDMCFVPGDDGLWQKGWAINAYGTILKTSDGGDTWTTITQTHSTLLGGITFADENTGYIATLDDKILKSTDGGDTWTVSYNGTSGFDKVAFKDANNGCIVGGQKLYTSDGGSNWNGSSGGSNYWDLDHAGGDEYYAVFLGGDLGYSDDGGQTWSNEESLGAMAAMVDFYDSDHGMFGGDVSKVKVTTDGGETWTTSTLATGEGLLVCGAWYDHDTLYATGSPGDLSKSTDGGQTWVTDTSFTGYSFRAMVITPNNVLYLCGEKPATSEGIVLRKYGVSPLNADFEASEETVCTGSTVDFTDLSVGLIDSWEWSFPGGTPSSSDEQNPSVTYNTPGIYDVELTVTDIFGNDTELKVDFITVLDNPGQTGTPEGETELCSNMTYQYTIDEVEFAQYYEWEIDPAEAGEFISETNEGVLETADDWTGDFTVRVRAVNICAEGEWSDYLDGSTYLSPDIFNVEGGGGYCLGGDGAEITLDGSETSVSYELLLDGESTDIIVEGNGSEISFGYLPDEGFYTVLAYTDNCDITMSGQVEVWIEFPPVEPAIPEGQDMVCNTDTTTYSSEGADDADSYDWILEPEEAGILTPDGLDATVVWNPGFAGTAEIVVFGINECGDGNLSPALEIQVDAFPAPEISGEDMVCSGQVETYEATGNTEDSFVWEVFGGMITEGDSTNVVMVEWGEVGTGTLSATVTTEAGCEGSSADFEVFIDDCTAIGELTHSDKLQIHPNPADDHLTITINKPVLRLEIFNMNGERLHTYNEISGQLKINTTDLSPGIYVVRILAGKELITEN
ncbi:MAG: PKD domain-containing protein [bacterium]